MKDRRDPRRYKLRVYLDAMEDMKLVTDEQWSDVQAMRPLDVPYMTKEHWVAYLTRCALEEAMAMADEREAA